MVQITSTILAAAAVFGSAMATTAYSSKPLVTSTVYSTSCYESTSASSTYTVTSSYAVYTTVCTEGAVLPTTYPASTLSTSSTSCPPTSTPAYSTGVPTKYSSVSAMPYPTGKPTSTPVPYTGAASANGVSGALVLAVGALAMAL